MTALDFRWVLGALVWVLVAVAPAAANRYTVDDTADEPDVTPGDEVCATASGSCTLRAAFMEAEASNFFLDEIILPAGHYRLTRPHTPRPTPSSTDGDLRIGPGPVTLWGAGSDVTIIEQTVEDRVLRVHRGEAVIQGVTLRGGRALSDEEEGDFGVPLPRNWGGGILADSSPGLTLRSVVVTDNEASETGGGGFGYVEVPVVLENVQITDNLGGSGVGGLGVTFAALEMVLSTVSGNQAERCGGISVGIHRGLSFNEVDHPVRIRLSRVTGNEALGERFSRIRDDTPGAFAGGICVESSRLEFDTFGGDFALEDTLVQGNVGGSGGGLFHRGVAGMRVVRSTFVGNNANDGGGLLIHGSGTIRNSTISANAALFNGSAIFHASLLVGHVDASGLFRPTPSNLAIRFSTIANNGVGALYTSHTSNNTQLIGTIFDQRLGSNCNIPMDSIGSNVENGTRCLALRPGPGDLFDVDPQLMPLADNGGATRTHALRSTSPAIDVHVLSGGCPGTDQRLALRPAGAFCDAGAYETGAVPLDVPGEPPLARGEVGGGSVRLVLSDGVIETLSAEGAAIEPAEPADGKDATWFLPSVGGYLGQTHTLLVQRGGLSFVRGKRRFETADWVVRLGPDGGQVVSYAGQPLHPPSFARFAGRGPAFGPPLFRMPRGLREGPLVLFDLEPVGQAPNLFVARLTERAAYHVNHQLNVRSFKPGMEFGTLLLAPEPVDPKEDPPGDPIPPPNFEFR